MPDIEALRRAWHNHCTETNDGREHFPRNMLLLDHNKIAKGIGSQFPVNSFNEMFSIALKWLGRRSIYTRVYCEYCLQTAMYSRIYFDFDGIEQGYIDSMKLLKRFPYTAIYFTGNGFSAYMHFKPIRLVNPKKAFRRFTNLIENQLGLKCIDYHTVGDINRVSRMPYTINKKPEADDRICFPVMPTWNMMEIMSQATKVTKYLPCFPQITPDIHSTIKAFDSPFEEEQKYMEPDALKRQSNRWIKEVNQLLEIAPNVVDGRHRIMFNLIVPRLVLAGVPDTEVHGICYKFIALTGKDYNDYQSYVQRDLDHTRRRVQNNENLSYNISNFLVRNPDLLKYFESKSNGTT